MKSLVAIMPNQEKLIYIASSPYGWGKGYNIGEAIKNCRKHKKVQPMYIAVYLITGNFLKAWDEIEVTDTTLTYKGDNCILLCQHEYNKDSLVSLKQAQKITNKYENSSNRF